MSLQDWNCFKQDKNCFGWLLFQLHNRNAAVPFSVSTETEACHASVMLQMLPNSILQRTCALSVNETYASEICHDRLVEIFIYLLPALVTKQTSQVDLVAKIAIDLGVKIGSRLFLLAADELRFFLDELKIGKFGASFEDSCLYQNRSALIGRFQKNALLVDIDDINLVTAFKVARKHVLFTTCL